MNELEIERNYDLLGADTPSFSMLTLYLSWLTDTIYCTKTKLLSSLSVFLFYLYVDIQLAQFMPTPSILSFFQRRGKGSTFAVCRAHTTIEYYLTSTTYS